MSDQPHQQTQRTKPKDNRATVALDGEALAREADEKHRRRGTGRAWSRDGTLEVYGWSEVYFDEIAPGVRSHHRNYHLRKWPAECSSLCEAKEVFAVYLLGFEAAPKPTALPLLGIGIPRIRELCHVAIVESPTFYREVRRDLMRMRQVLPFPVGETGKADRALIRRYEQAAVLIAIRNLRDSAPATKTV